jgi:putative transposase
MLIRKAFKFRLKALNQKEINSFNQFAGSHRFIYNLALFTTNEHYRINKKHLNYNIICEEYLPKWKNKYKFLQNVPSQVLQQTLMDLDKAFKMFFKKISDKPNFKKKGKSNESFRFPQHFELDQINSRIKLPKIGWIRYCNSRKIKGKPKNITVSIKNGNYYVSIQTEYEETIKPNQSDSKIGLDKGVTHFLSDSNNNFYEHSNKLKQIDNQIIKLQRQLKRKKLKSQNWRKLQCKIAKLHEHKTNIRHDTLHKISTNISKNHAFIAIENLKVTNMSKSAKGTIENPGTNVAQKSGLNRSILNQGWSIFDIFLTYKCIENGSWLEKVPPHYSSQECDICGFTSKENRKTQAIFKCIKCENTKNADTKAAITVLKRGLEQLKEKKEGNTLNNKKVKSQDNGKMVCGSNLEEKDRKQKPAERNIDLDIVYKV